MAIAGSDETFLQECGKVVSDLHTPVQPQPQSGIFIFIPGPCSPSEHDCAR